MAGFLLNPSSMGSLRRRWHWLACLALAGGCALNPQPDLPGEQTGGAPSGGAPPVLNTGGSAGTVPSGAGAQPSGEGGASQGFPEGGADGELEGGAPSFGEAGQAGAAEAGALGVVSR